MGEHLELCYKTGEKFNKSVALINYKCTFVSEEPDVLVFDNHAETTLYEIKVYKPDFFNDFKKPHRIQIKIDKRGEKEIVHTYAQSMGKYRYYVCFNDIIGIEDLPIGWGLIWYNKEKESFLLKKKSGLFKHNKGLECRLLVNALKRYKSGITDSILIKNYTKIKKKGRIKW